MTRFAITGFLPVLLAVAVAAGILGFASFRGGSFFKKQGVAWGLTLLMVFAAIGIGYAKAPINNPAPEPNLPSAPPPSSAAETVPPAPAGSFVWDDANVLSGQTERELDERNERLWNNYNVTIGVVTCNYGRDDLGEYALKQAEEMGLGGYDFIVALDIKGDNYWLLQGADLVRDFTDNDCSDYAYSYMEVPFARGDYDSAVLQLTGMLEAWYEGYDF